MKYMFFTFLLYLLTSKVGYAQQSINALFIGNSYTYVNNLPKMTANIAESRGNILTWKSNTPGACTFQKHCSNKSVELIAEGGWDIVVLQEQSRRPSFLQDYVDTMVYPYATCLVEEIYAANPCAEPMFYMTWGRRDGDSINAQTNPVVATYEGMDSLICERYIHMAESNDASLSPVGRVWRYLRSNCPEIDLYRSDGSHPSVAGTYAAACSFYVMFFNESPDSIAYIPAGVTGQQANSIHRAVKEVVYLQLNQWKRLRPEIILTVGEPHDGEVQLSQRSIHADSIVWDFGDGTTIVSAPSDSTIIHKYAESGSYEVTVEAIRHCMTDTAHATVNITNNTANAISMPAITLDGQSVDMSSTDISIFTIDGRRVSYSHISSGIYLVRVGTQTARIVKL